jgi:hypothetical protein
MEKWFCNGEVVLRRGSDSAMEMGFCNIDGVRRRPVSWVKEGCRILWVAVGIRLGEGKKQEARSKKGFEDCKINDVVFIFLKKN